MQLNPYGKKKSTTPAWNAHPSNDHRTKWEYYSTNQYGTYSKKYGHNVMSSYTTLIVIQVERKQQAQKKRLLQYKRLKADLLSPNDYCLIGHPEIVIINWKTRKKKQQLKILDNAHREWKKECKLREEGQKQINELAGWKGLFIPPNEDNTDEPDTDEET